MLSPPVPETRKKEKVNNPLKHTLLHIEQSSLMPSKFNDKQTSAKIIQIDQINQDLILHMTIECLQYLDHNINHYVVFHTTIEFPMLYIFNKQDNK
uniref:Peptidyl-prolyl cis-trans isomerase n=1 Tax=Rhizophora mucronata TaxID=61149 RepID=A0A2P2LYE7_RHIMU